MKFLVTHLLLFLTLNSYAATLELACKVATIKISDDGSDISADKIIFEQTIAISEADSAIILLEGHSARLIGENDIQMSDEGKMVFALSQNIDPDSEDENGLNVIAGKLDFSKPNGFVSKSLTQVGSLSSIKLTVIDFENNIALKCVN